MKRKKWWVGGILLGILCVVGTIFLVLKYQQDQKEKRRQEEEKKLVEKIKSSFYENVRTKEKKKLYQKKEEEYQEIGFIEAGVSLPLEEPKIKSSKDIYFKVQGLEYYIDYQDLEEASYNIDTSFNKFVSTKAVTTETTELYQGEKIAISISHPMTFDIILESDSVYYVSFLGNIYTLHGPQTTVEKEVGTLLEKISVFRFKEDCSKEKVEEIFSLWKEKEYQSITKEEFSYWIKGMGHLPEKKIFIIGTDTQKENLKELCEKYAIEIESDLTSLDFKEGDQQLKVGDTTYYNYLITNDTGKDRVEEMLAGIKKKVEKPISVEPTVAVLNYHFFYDAATEACNESICLSTENFRKQLSYLKENGYKTLTMQEFYDWKTRKINIPEKSVLLTIDDGAMGTDTHLPQILEEYQMHASLFLITGWWDISKYQKTSYLEIYSHGDELHHNNYCKGDKCGYKPLLLSKEEIVADLNLSLSKGVGRLAFCYPFYQTSRTLEAAIKEVGIPLAFAGGNRKTTRNTSNYYIPRFVVYKGTSMNQFIQMIS